MKVIIDLSELSNGTIMKIGEDLGLGSDYNVMNVYECNKYINEVIDELQDRTYNLVDEYFYEMKNQIFS